MNREEGEKAKRDQWEGRGGGGGEAVLKESGIGKVDN
jgi:hypothetical protein